MKNKLLYFFPLKRAAFILLFLLYFSLFSQNRKIDSLLKLVNSTLDTTKAKNLVLICKQYVLTAQFDDALKSIKDLENLANSPNFTKSKKDYFIAFTYQNYGSYYAALSDYNNALLNQTKALEIREKINDKNGIANSNNNIGNIYFYWSDYDKALGYYLKSLTIREEIGDKRGLAVSYGNIGLIYKNQRQFDRALTNYLVSLKLRKELNDKEGMAAGYGNIGNLIGEKARLAPDKKDKIKLFKKSVEYIQLSLQLSEEIGEKIQAAMCYGNLGNKNEDWATLTDSPEEKLNYYNTALEYYFKQLALYEKLPNKRGIGTACSNLGHLYVLMGKDKEGFPYLDRALTIATEIGNKDGIAQALSSLASYYSHVGDFKKAYTSYNLFVGLRDSITGEQTKKEIDNINSRYITEKKDKEILLLNKDKEQQEIVNKHQNTLLIFVSFGLIIMLILAFFAYRGYRQKKDANVIITSQKEDAEKKNILIEEQKRLVEEKNKDITDSINYAKKIQEAILPAKEIKYDIFANGFVLFKPRDIVSGDFYWFTRKNNKRIISAVDCTGHGVPGAFMSMIGNTFLNEIVDERNITEPAEILSELRHMIIKSLKQNEEESQSRDGMDMALISIDDTNMVLEFAGANNPIWHFRNGVCTEYTADKRPIGFYRGKGLPFTNHKIEFQKGDSIYLFTDGYADQFGGPKGKKFKYKQFQEVLTALQRTPVLNQEKALLDKFDQWKGDLEQVDDVLVIGIKL